MSFTLPPPPPVYPEPSPSSELEIPRQPCVAVFSAANELMEVFSEELERQLSRERGLMQLHFDSERAKLYRDMQQEREALGRKRADLEKEIQREREQKERERTMRFELERVLRGENEALKLSVARLQATIDTIQEQRGSPIDSEQSTNGLEELVGFSPFT
ncbi:hypothetical protein NP233_g3523 [Leucocoprinus birnbaumii]|uniref:Uncharacterized protein n=1 Tax=Leucocoprinus birnbaumii TaxID=56174 RepID=A0AAD5VX34_9AGAR|nr:hypothetical protein NP233_g3523 [Leucocoprinus birnbaumii]